MISFAEPISVVYPVPHFVRIGDGTVDPRGTVTYRYGPDGVRVSYHAVGEYGAGWSRLWAEEPSDADVGDWVRSVAQGVETSAVRHDTPEIAARFFARVRLSPEQLLADPTFRRLARAAAEKGKSYSADLLEYERKPVVAEAVRVVRAEVDAERAELARIDADRRAAEDARLERERPTRDAVLDAYDRCDYRTCTQGHSTHVEIGARVGATGNTAKGNQYSSRCTWRMATSSHRLYVRPDYLTRVAAVGPTRHAGMLVLDAEAVGCLPDLRVVYRLTLARQGRGTALETTTVDVTAGGGLWVGLPTRAKAVRMPAPILADYLEDHEADIDVQQLAAMRS